MPARKGPAAATTKSSSPRPDSGALALQLFPPGASRLLTASNPGQPGAAAILGAILGAGLGAIASLAFAPISFWPAILFAQLGLLFVLQPRGFWSALCALWAFWACHFGTAMYWAYIGLSKTLGLGAYAAVALTVAIGLVYSAILLLPWLLYCAAPANSRLRLACFPLAWVLCEWLRYWILGGLTWLNTGYAFQATWLAGWIPLFGVLAASIATCLSAVLIYLYLDNRRDTGKARHAAPALLAAIWLAGALLGAINWTQPLGAPIPATIVQPQAKAWLERLYTAEERAQIWNQEVASLSSEHWRPGLLLWPERGLRQNAQQTPAMLERLQTRARASSTALITGGDSYAQDTDELFAHNSIYGLGQASGIYRKQKLAPIGERDPLEYLGIFAGLLESTNASRLAVSDGKSPELIKFDLNGQTYSIAGSICYEVAWGRYLNTYAGEANILVNLSNDRWFNDSAELEQALQIAQIRALEQQKPLLRAAFGGISAHIDYRGNIVTRAADTRAQVLVSEVRPRQGRTPYSRFGDLPVLLLAGIWPLFLLSLGLRRPGT